MKFMYRVYDYTNFNCFTDFSARVLHLVGLVAYSRGIYRVIQRYLCARIHFFRAEYLLLVHTLDSME
jgi:hypothetical protein